MLPKKTLPEDNLGVWRPPLSVEMAGVLSFEERPMIVFVYVNPSRQVGDVEHIKVFASEGAAERWFKANDPEGVAFEYDVMEESAEQLDPFFESPGG